MGAVKKDDHWSETGGSFTLVFDGILEDESELWCPKTFYEVTAFVVSSGCGDYVLIAIRRLDRQNSVQPSDVGARAVTPMTFLAAHR